METSSSLPDEAPLALDKRLFEGLYEGIMSVTPSWCCTYVNRAAESILQKQREELLGKNIWEVFPELVDTLFWEKCYEAAEAQRSMAIDAVCFPTGATFLLHIIPSEAGVALSFHKTLLERNPSMQDIQQPEQGIDLQASLIEHASDAILVHDQNRTIVSWSRGAERLYGWTAQEAIGQIAHTLLQTRFPLSQQALDHILATGEPWEGELVQTCKNGTRVTVESRQGLIPTTDNRFLTILDMHRDITQRKLREREQHAQYRQLAALVESSDIPMIGKTRDGLITSWNRAAERTYGYSAQEVLGQSITLLFPEDRRDEFDRIMERISKGERVDLYDTVRRRKDGGLLPVSISVSPIYDSEGQIIGASDIAHDITERKRVEGREQFLTQVSHVLSSTLDYQETLANMARLIVPQLADWFTVDLLNASGTIELMEVAHRDPEQVRLARTRRERSPIDANAAFGVPRVARTGQAELYPEITDALLEATLHNAEELAQARQIGSLSAMLVPLRARGRTIGVMSFVVTDSDKRYDERDLELAEEVGRRAGVALDNAYLYREAQQSRDQFDIILQGVADGIIVYAAESRLLYANEAAAQMTGYASVQEMLATTQVDILSKYELIDEKGQPFPPANITHRRVFAGEPEAQAIIGYRAREGEPSIQWSLVKSRPVIGERGNAVMVITITQDITERMKAEQRKDEFMGMTSHELKTPVTSLKGFTHVLQRRLAKGGDTQGLHYLARMDAQLDKLTTLISDLLDISRMQSGKLVLRAEPVDLDELLGETVENVQAATGTHRLRIEGSTGAQVLGDRERLGQVYINLLTNAIKYSPRADSVIVRLFQDPDTKQAIVSIQDFGIGIEQSHHEKIFERFYQVTDPEEKTYPGLGIGLYISSDIVARHHGRMWVKSRKREGATFFVALPLLG